MSTLRILIRQIGKDIKYPLSKRGKRMQKKNFLSYILCLEYEIFATLAHSYAKKLFRHNDVIFLVSRYISRQHVPQIFSRYRNRVAY